MRTKPTAKETLQQAIVLLQAKQEAEWQLLKIQLDEAWQSIQPVNVIRSTVHQLATSPGIKNDLLQFAVVKTTDYLSKKVLVKKSGNPLKKILGAALEFVAGALVTKHNS